MRCGERGDADDLLQEPARRPAGLPDRPFSADRSTSVFVLSLSGRSGSLKTSRDNSRLGAFNSRLGRREFPVRSATGIRTQRYDLPNLLRRQMAVSGANATTFPLLREKPGILHSTGATSRSPASGLRPRHLLDRSPISGRGNACRSRRPRGFAGSRPGR
jgi:hypothetical protein